MLKLLENVKLSNIKIMDKKIFDDFVEKENTLGCFNVDPDSIIIPTNYLHLDKVSHSIVNLKLIDGYMYGDIKVLDTPCGKILKAYYDEGIDITYGIIGTQLDGILDSITYIMAYVVDRNNIEYAEQYATKYHKDQQYGELPYIYHLKGVKDILANNCFCDTDLLIAAVLHDILEDTNITYDKLVQDFNEYIANYVYCVTRINKEPNKVLKSFERIYNYNNYNPAIIKLADRIFNLQSCITNKKSKLIEKYLNEDNMFQKYVINKLKENNNINKYHLNLINTYEQLIDIIKK